MPLAQTLKGASRPWKVHEGRLFWIVDLALALCNNLTTLQLIANEIAVIPSKGKRVGRRFDPAQLHQMLFVPTTSERPRVDREYLMGLIWIRQRVDLAKAAREDDAPPITYLVVKFG